jgi:hypothetical protein
MMIDNDDDDDVKRNAIPALLLPASYMRGSMIIYKSLCLLTFSYLHSELPIKLINRVVPAIQQILPNISSNFPRL